MANRFICRKITIKSLSRQGWVLSQHSSYAVYDRDWKKHCHYWDTDPVKYIRFTEKPSKAFVQATAKYLNEHVSPETSTHKIDGFAASKAVLAASGFTDGISAYGDWCEKFDPEFGKNKTA